MTVKTLKILDFFEKESYFMYYFVHSFCKKDKWCGTLTELLKCVNACRIDFGHEKESVKWPRNESCVGKTLTQYENILAMIGFNVKRLTRKHPNDRKKVLVENSNVSILGL